MYILCDTCSVLMLIRIAPKMFIDDRFGCVTVKAVRDELTRVQRFKIKYPWRDRFKKHVKTLPTSEIENDKFKLASSTVNMLHNAGKINEKTNKIFDLSWVDRYLASVAVAHGYMLTSVDDDLIVFLEQEFKVETISPLGIINFCLSKELLSWNAEKQEIIEDWEFNHEHPQPKEEIRTFRELTGMDYKGP